MYAAELLEVCIVTTVKDQERDAYLHRYDDVMLRVRRCSHPCLTSYVSSITRRHIRCDRNELAAVNDDEGCHECDEVICVNGSGVNVDECVHTLCRTAVWLRIRNNRGGASVRLRSLMYSVFVRFLR